MKQKILLAMSGGVDSSVAALLLKKQGYEVLGAFMKNWSTEKDDMGECLWQGEREYAIKVAKMLGIRLITLDFEKQYRKLVVDEMFKLYKKGITPNPDINCNNKVKFPLLIKEAKKLGCDFVATGHYARIKKINVRKNAKDKYVNKKFSKNDVKLNSNRITANEVSSKLGGGGWGVGDGNENKIAYELLRAKDESKDQSYFLYRLNQRDLSKTLFPIGELTKTRVREIAKKNNFPNAEKKGTVGICFIGKVNLKKFLQKKIPPKSGKILNPEGKIIGQHDGIYYYTIGQRIGPRFGLDVNRGNKEQKKWYVTRKNLKKNEIIAAPEGHELNFRKNIIIKQPHWISSNPLDVSSKKVKLDKKSNSVKNKSITSEARQVGVVVGDAEDKHIGVFSRIRQVGELLPSILSYNKKTKHFKVSLNKAITGVSEGQAVVLYKGEKCLGGGVISF